MWAIRKSVLVVALNIVEYTYLSKMEKVKEIRSFGSMNLLISRSYLKHRYYHCYSDTIKYRKG